MSSQNLALACPGCNLHKADKTTAIEPVTDEDAQLFHPIQQHWSEHFRFQGYEIEGLTSAGRATVVTPDLNHPGVSGFAKWKRPLGCILRVNEEIFSVLECLDYSSADLTPLTGENAAFRIYNLT